MSGLGANGQGVVDDGDQELPAAVGSGGIFADADDEVDRQEFDNGSPIDVLARHELTRCGERRVRWGRVRAAVSSKCLQS